MITVAGAALVPFWEWRCPSSMCGCRLSDRNEARLAARAHKHWLDKHGPIDGQGLLFD